MEESETSYGVSILLTLQARWDSGVSNHLSLDRGYLRWARNKNTFTVSTHKQNWEKYLAVCFSSGTGHFQGVCFSQLLIFCHPHAPAAFFTHSSSLPGPFSCPFYPHPSLTVSLIDSPNRKKGFLQQWFVHVPVFCTKDVVPPTTFASYTSVSTLFWFEKSFQVCLLSLASVCAYCPLQKKIIWLLINFPLCL